MILLIVIWRYQNRLCSSILVYQLIYWFYITCMKYNNKILARSLSTNTKNWKFWRLYLAQLNSQHPNRVPLSKYLYTALFTHYIQETTIFSSNRDNVPSKHVNLVRNINNVHLIFSSNHSVNVCWIVGNFCRIKWWQIRNPKSWRIC